MFYHQITWLNTKNITKSFKFIFHYIPWWIFKTFTSFNTYKLKSLIIPYRERNATVFLNVIILNLSRFQGNLNRFIINNCLNKINSATKEIQINDEAILKTKCTWFFENKQDDDEN